MNIDDTVSIDHPTRDGGRSISVGRVTWIEDFGEYMYFGYVCSLDAVRAGSERWGAARVYKNEATAPKYAARVTTIQTAR